MTPEQYLQDNLPATPEDYRWEVSYFLNRGYKNGYRIEISLRRSIGGEWHLGYDSTGYPLTRTVSTVDVDLGQDMLKTLIDQAHLMVDRIPDGVDEELEFLRSISGRYVKTA